MAKFLEYNVRDVVLVEELEEKLGFIDLIITMLTVRSVITSIHLAW